MHKYHGHLLNWFLLLVTSASSLHAYRIVVTNTQNHDIYAAVYRRHDAHALLTRTSAVKLIKAGDDSWFGGVLENSDHIHFQLYAASTREALSESLSSEDARREPYLLFNVGTGDKNFTITSAELTLQEDHSLDALIDVQSATTEQSDNTPDTFFIEQSSDLVTHEGEISLALESHTVQEETHITLDQQAPLDAFMQSQLDTAIAPLLNHIAPETEIYQEDQSLTMEPVVPEQSTTPSSQPSTQTASHTHQAMATPRIPLYKHRPYKHLRRKEI